MLISFFLNPLRSILIKSNAFPVFQAFNKCIVRFLNSITIILLQKNKHIKQVFIVGGAAGTDFCPFLSDLDLFIVLRACDPDQKTQILKQVFSYYKAASKLNPFAADFFQSFVFENDASSYTKFWYFYYDIAEWRTRAGKRFLTDFPHGDTCLLITANWDRALSWYIQQCHFLFDVKLPRYSRHHKIPIKVSFFSRRIQSFCAHKEELFSQEDYRRNTISQNRGQNHRVAREFRKSLEEQVNDFLKSFRCLQYSANLILKRLPPRHTISCEDPSNTSENKSAFNALPYGLDLRHISLILSAPGSMFIFIAEGVEDSIINQCVNTISHRSNASVCEIRVFPLNVLPLIYMPYPMSVVHRDPSYTLESTHPYLEYILRARAIYGHGSLINVLARHPDAPKHLTLLAKDFLRTSIALEIGKFRAQAHTLMSLTQDNRERLSPELIKLAETLLEPTGEVRNLDEKTLYKLTADLREYNLSRMDNSPMCSL